MAAGARAGGERLILLDANALMTAARLRIDLARKLAEAAPGWEAVVPSSVLRELDGLGTRRHAPAARALAARFARVEAPGSGDAALLAAAGPGRAVLTNDRALRRALRARGVTVLFVRGRSAVDVDGAL